LVVFSEDPFMKPALYIEPIGRCAVMPLTSRVGRRRGGLRGGFSN
jgi:hypothetical protein